MKHSIYFYMFSVLFSFWFSPLPAQTPDYYFPSSALDSINSEIPEPGKVVGFPIGKWHLSHDKIIRYSDVLAEASPRVERINYATSHEGRPLFVLRITSPEHQENIEHLRKNHLASAEGAPLPHEDALNPVVLYQGNSIHGDESSGANAAMLYAWYLAASEGEKVQRALEETVILLDPCFNPDGLHRFSTWVNANTGTAVRNSDPADREFHEPWPSGRTNHYWFDLNRDWLLVQHPESRGRIRMFNRWLPHVLTDHHEMGSDATFFFQPGIPSRTNPVTLEKNQEITGKIAEFHSRFLDEIGSLYYSKERFDDYYYGKGSTYPDVRGSIGILFEQASSRGHQQETDHGTLTFPFTIKNQLTTQRSTLQAGLDLNEELKEYQRHFFNTQRQRSEDHSVQAYLVRRAEDPVRWNSFLKLLENHNITPRKLTENVATEDLDFRKNEDVIISMNADNFFLKRTLFETVETFPDSLFYDVSTWTLPLAFNLQYAEWSDGTPDQISGEVASPKNEHENSTFDKSDYGYILPWTHFKTATAAGKLLKEEYEISVATKPLTAQTTGGRVRFDRGSLFIPAHQKNRNRLSEHLEAFSKTSDLPIFSVQSGATGRGIDLGSPSMEPLEYPNTLLLAGSGIRSYDAGEIWHLFNERMHLPLTKAAPERLHRIDLSKYERIIIPQMYYSRWNDRARNALKKWVQAGGVLILERGAIAQAKSLGLPDITDKNEPSDSADEESVSEKVLQTSPYDKMSRDRGSQRIGGAIFEAEMDTTHPLCYGYADDGIALFKRGMRSIGTSENPYAQPIVYTKNPLLSGYAPEEVVERIGNTAAVRIFKSGNGRVICFADNTHFRAYFRGTEKLMINAVFFGHIIDGQSAESISGK